ncbi:MAG: low molecular weight phosphotyrosine protein phosphatase [Rhodospirillaceae bacterium]|nr:low molecular weight phosphotyrosine protein phosphatase [Rhodospirillaceae bacterium]
MIKVLFVCTGNICRSPNAEGIFRHFAAADDVEIETDSAGTHGYHIGEEPDPRTVKAAAARGFNLSALRARRVTREDFEKFDLILAMDRGHFAHLDAMRPNGARAQVKLFLDYHPGGKLKDVPDPYYGGPQGFEDVLDIVEETSRALLARLRA